MWSGPEELGAGAGPLDRLGLRPENFDFKIFLFANYIFGIIEIAFCYKRN